MTMATRLFAELATVAAMLPPSKDSRRILADVLRLTAAELDGRRDAAEHAVAEALDAVDLARDHLSWLAARLNSRPPR